MAQHDEPSGWPSYDIDETLAGLTLEEEEEEKAWLASRSRTAATPPPLTPDPPSTPVKPSSRAAPSLPVTPARNTDAPPNPTIYRFSSPKKSGYTPDWSEAGSATQGSPSSHVQVVRPPNKNRKKNQAYVVLAYVVFRGRTIGVMQSWPEVQAAISGVRFALHQGYPSLDLAKSAFEFAHLHGWTSQGGSWSALPLSLSCAPSPVDAEQSAAPTLMHRSPDDPWYVVYAGINPGVFPTNVECALNVLGIRASLHESVPSYAEAKAKFARAKERGEVHVRRARTV
ncbi:hypothetical protein B0H11DRAFT_2231787 [Mycena galericulata]|nr:hypothetical protein B0H11DRAFT_2231787 [Mycena galericulata]